MVKNDFQHSCNFRDVFNDGDSSCRFRWWFFKWSFWNLVCPEICSNCSKVEQIFVIEHQCECIRMGSLDVIDESLFVFEADPAESAFEWSLWSYCRHDFEVFGSFLNIFWLFQLIIKSLLDFKWDSSFYIIQWRNVTRADVNSFSRIHF